MHAGCAPRCCALACHASSARARRCAASPRAVITPVVPLSLTARDYLSRSMMMRVAALRVLQSVCCVTSASREPGHTGHACSAGRKSYEPMGCSRRRPTCFRGCCIRPPLKRVQPSDACAPAQPGAALCVPPLPGRCNNHGVTASVPLSMRAAVRDRITSSHAMCVLCGTIGHAIGRDNMRKYELATSCFKLLNCPKLLR